MNAIFIVLIMVCSCRNNQKDVEYIFSDKPKFSEKRLTSFSELYSIDMLDVSKLSISNSCWMDVDEEDNLYVLDLESSEILVFNDEGENSKKMGQGQGFGPKQLSHPVAIYIFENVIYIYEINRGIKLWDLNGEYKGYINLGRFYNTGLYKPIQEFIIASGAKIGSIDSIMEWELARYSLNGEKLNAIATLFVDPKKEPEFLPMYLIPVDTDYNFYYPVSRNEYMINKYDLNGKSLLRFGRDYKREPYSKTVKDTNTKVFGEAIKTGKFPKLQDFPPIVRFIYVDERDFVWIIVGEWELDSVFETQVRATIDVFNTDGEFIYTFKIPDIRLGFVIKHGRLYLPPRKYDPVLRVYNVNYGF